MAFDKRQALRPKERVGTGVPFESLSGFGIQSSQLVARNNLIAQLRGSLSGAKSVVEERVARKGVVGAGSFLE